MAIMKSYRRKGSSHIQAISLDDATADVIADLCGGQVVEEKHPVNGYIDYAVNVPTLDGVKRLSLSNNTILVNIKGRFDVIDKTEFFEEYELNTRS